MSGATNPTLLANTAPLWVGLGALIFFREKLSLMFWAGLLLAMADAVFSLGLDRLRSVSLGVGTLSGRPASSMAATHSSRNEAEKASIR
jgi:drug/metabolite transporter (DMT)-like permease